jgi:hypothetical protein
MCVTYWRSMVYLVIGLGLVLATGNLDPNHATRAEAAGGRRTQKELFQNSYVPAVGPESVGAQLYPSPRPTPPSVGQTYITYQPLAPEEFLYRHFRVYKTKHAGAPNTYTTAIWR